MYTIQFATIIIILQQIKNLKRMHLLFFQRKSLILCCNVKTYDFYYLYEVGWRGGGGVDYQAPSQNMFQMESHHIRKRVSSTWASQQSGLCIYSHTFIVKLKGFKLEFNTITLNSLTLPILIWNIKHFEMGVILINFAVMIFQRK